MRLALDIASDTITRITGEQYYDWWDFYYYNITGEHNHDSGLLKEAVMGKVTAIMQTAVGISTITPR